MHDNDHLGAAVRSPRNRKIQISRKVLTAFGTWHELSVDGHEKLGPMALQMGLVGFHIYGMRDKWSGKALWLVVVPNARLATTIGHIYLDFAATHGSTS